MLASLRHYKTALLTTYRRDGMTAVDTPVSIVVDGDRVLFRTWEDSGKAKRLRYHPIVDIRPCTFRGEPAGPAARGRVCPLEGAEARRAAFLLGRSHPVLQRWALPLSYRLLRHRTLYYAVTLMDGEEIRSNEGCPD
ncbi:hypothetical protein GCM10027294_08270 [Marinactinospora endophytica]